jgi:predicted dehydrogenase
VPQFAHFEACRKARNAELYAICDVAGDLVERMVAVHTPRVTYTDYQGMLSEAEGAV